MSKSKTKNKLRIAVYFDSMGSMMSGGRLDEFKKMKEDILTSNHFKRFDCVVHLVEHLEHVEQSSYDILFVDFGGLMLGQSGFAGHNCKVIERLLDDKHNLVIGIGSKQTYNFLDDYFDTLPGEPLIQKHPMLFYMDWQDDLFYMVINKIKELRSERKDSSN